MAFPARRDKEAAVARIEFQKSVAKVPAHFVIILADTGTDRGGNAGSCRSQPSMASDNPFEDAPRAPFQPA